MSSTLLGQPRLTASLAGQLLPLFLPFGIFPEPLQPKRRPMGLADTSNVWQCLHGYNQSRLCPPHLVRIAMCHCVIKQQAALCPLAIR